MRLSIKGIINRLFLVFLTCLFIFITSNLQAQPDRIVRVATYHYPPVAFKDNDGSYKGVQVEVFEEIARLEGWKIEYLHGTWVESLEKIEQHEVDLLLAIGYTEQRATKYAFNEETFLRNWGQLYAPKGHKIKDLSDLKGATIAIYQKGIFSTTLQEMLENNDIQATYLQATDYDEIFSLIDRGEVDAGVMSRSYAIFNANNYSAIATPVIFAPTELRIAAPLDTNSDILKAIDARLRAFKDNRDSFYYAVMQKWTIDVTSSEPGKYRLPRWVWYIVVVLGGGALLFLGTSILLDRKVKQHTQELKKKNKLLRLEMKEKEHTEQLLRIEMKEKERTEKSLREHERQLSTLIDNIPGLVYRCSNAEEWPVEFVSKASLELLGFNPDDLMDCSDTDSQTKKNSLWSLIHPDDRSDVGNKRKAAILEREPYQIMYRIATRTGLYKWVCDYGGCLINRENKPVALEGIIADVTPQQEAEINLRHENQKLRSVMKERISFGSIVGGSRVMQEVYENILKAAASKDPVVITGESGTGKELVAKTVHEMSQRSAKPFIPVNCGAIPEGLLESEFFGSKKGAFTGADTDKDGFLVAAGGGTLFLDEIGDISLAMQVKLLRALEGGGFSPVGSNEVIQVDTRIISATNKDLLKMVQEGTMREDFYYRIHIIPITLPPLRERRSDIPLLVDHFLDRYPKDARPTISGKIMEAFYDHNWPGNIRELQNILKRYAALNEIPFGLEHQEDHDTKFSAGFVPEAADLRTVLSQFEKEYLLRILEQNDWRRTKVADLLKINRRTLYKKIQAFNLTQKDS